MPNAYSIEQTDKLHKNLPRDLQDALFSEETSEIIGNACDQYGIEDERVATVAKYVGDVLSGFILPSEFEDALRKNVEMPEVLVKAISQEINRFVFYPVKASLQQIHRGIEKQADEQELGIPTPRHSMATDTYMVGPEETEEEPQDEESPQTKRDPYQEDIDEE